MLCTACQHSNDDQARFCDQCGQALETRCLACHSPNRAGARFCSHCGHSLTATPASGPVRVFSLEERLDHLQRYVPQHLTDKILAHRGRLAGERKLVTVLFADLAGYSTLSAQLGEEKLFALMDTLYERLIHAVHHYEGTVNELTGDGLVAFFGAPLAVEQAPQRAVRAALALQAAVTQSSTLVEQTHGVRLQLRVGINTGPVIVGSIGNNLRMDYKAVGHTVNLAARMEQAASPGAVLVTEQTHKLIAGYFDCHDLGLMRLKGLPGTTRVYQVQGECGVRVRIEVARERGFTRLVGRESELTLLRQCYELTQGGRGQVVSIIGDAGIGKSRLLAECRQALAGPECTWLEGRSHPYGVSLAYGPIIELLKQQFQIAASDRDAESYAKIQRGLAAFSPVLAAAAPYLGHVLGVEAAGGPLAALTPEALKHRTFEALLGLWNARALQRPLVLVIEDVHWADPTTIDFLTVLIEQIAGARLLLLCTYRPEFVCPWARKSYHRVITLTPLTPPDSYTMLTALLDTPHIQDDLGALVLGKAEGVPFFIEELVTSLRETGAIVRCDGQWQLSSSAAAVPVPNTVEEVLMARIDRLPEGAKGVLQIGAVMGREWSEALLREIAGLTEPELLAHLAALTDAELLYARGLPPQTAYVFKHALTQDVAYRSLLSSRRQELHRRVAVTLEALFPDRLEEYYGPLAYHYYEAAQEGEVGKAVAYAIQAGQRHMALPAYAEAVRFYQLALHALERQPSPDATQRSQLLLALGEAQRRNGDIPHALETFQSAAQIARELGAPEALAAAALGFEETRWGPGLPGDTAAQLLTEALERLGEEESTLKARLLGSLSRALAFTPAFARARSIAEQAVAMARRLGDPATLAATLKANYYQRNGPGALPSPARLALTEELLALSEATGDRELRLFSHAWRLFDLMELGDIPAVDQYLDLHAQLADELQEPFYQYLNATFRALRATFDGRFEASEHLAQHAFALGQRLQGQDVLGLFGMQIFTLRREQGRLQEVEPVVSHFVRTHPRTSIWRPGLALIYSELGREQQARTEFEYFAASDFADIPHDALWVTCIAYLSEVCAFLGDAHRAALLYPLLLPYDGYTILVGPTAVCYGAATRYLGLLAATMCRWEEAQRHFDDALAMNADMGARPWLAHTQYAYATMLLLRNQPGDCEQARAFLDEALATACDLGMHALERRITGQSVRQRPAAPATTAGLMDLSPREVEVLHLLALGKSNRDIAEALCISLNTVATHVRNILTKTGAANRTEAAAYALRHGVGAE